MSGPSPATLLARSIGRLLAAWALCLVVLLLTVPVAGRVRAGAESLGFLIEFLSEDLQPARSVAARPALREDFPVAPDTRADLWRPDARGLRTGLILIHGLTPQGKDDPRLTRTAALLARSGFAVLVPELPALRGQRLDPADARVVAAAITRLAGHPAVRQERLAVVAVSVGVGPALTAAADPGLGARVRLLLSLGGYAEARELIRYFTTGTYDFAGIAGRVPVDPALARAFLEVNLALVQDPADRAAVAAHLAGGAVSTTAGAEARAVLAVLSNRDPTRVDELLRALPAATQALLDALSPARHARSLSSRLLVLHGKGDPAIPFTESLRLAEAADPRRTRLVVVELVGHVEGRTPGMRGLVDLARLWSVAYELFRG